MNKLETILRDSVEQFASDIYIVPGARIRMRIGLRFADVTQERLTPQESEELLKGIYALTNRRPIERLIDQGDDDFSFSLPGIGRFRCCAYMQRGSLAAVLRVVRFELPDASKLGIPDGVMNLAHTQNGMVLITGPAGSGKSTTMACLIDRINRERQGVPAQSQGLHRLPARDAQRLAGLRRGAARGAAPGAGRHHAGRDARL